MTWKCIVYLFMIWSMQVHRISLSLYKQLRNKECTNSNSFGERHKSTGKSGRKFVRCGTSSRTKPSFSVWFETRAAVTAILFWRENGGGFRRKSPHCSEPGIRGNRNSCAAFGWKESRREETEGERESGGGRVLEREEKEAERFICYFPFLSKQSSAEPLRRRKLWFCLFNCASAMNRERKRQVLRKLLTWNNGHNILHYWCVWLQNENGRKERERKDNIKERKKVKSKIII